MTIDPWATKESQVIFNGYNFDVVEDTVELPTGTTYDFEYIADGDGVIVLPITPSGNVIVVNEWRQPTNRVVEYGLAGGRQESDETLEQTAKRELLEETGYSSTELTFVGEFEKSNGTLGGSNSVFIAHDCEKTQEPESTDTETTEITELPLEELQQAVVQNEVKDGKTALAVGVATMNPESSF